MTNEIKHQPKVSVVVTARNDNHGGGFLRRMQIFATAWLKQCERHKLRAELIVVEWNPMDGMSALHEVLEWPEANEYCSVRFVEVSKSIHDEYVYGDNLGLYQMIAKNVGIRRALGEFVLCTNIDLIFSDEIMSYMASENLDTGRVYRVDRLDIPAEVPENGSVDEQLKYCEENLLRNNARYATINVQTGQKFVCVTGQPCESARLHFNACGDFKMMSKEDWYRMRGYAEFDMYSAHIDSIGMLTSHFSGLEQVVLEQPMATYHIEHGFSMIAEKAGALFRELHERGVPQVSLLELGKMAEDMQFNGRPILFNEEDWGLAKRDLPETLVVRADWQEEGDVDHSQQLLCSEKIDYLSVVVTTEPTKGDVDRLLEQLAAQSISHDCFELVLRREDLEAENQECLKSSGLNYRLVDQNGPDYLQWVSTALEESVGETVLFIPADAEFGPELLKWHFDYHQANPTERDGVHAAYSHITYGVTGPVNYIGDSDAERQAAAWLTGYFEKQWRHPNQPKWTHVTNTNFSCNRDVLLRYGGFDPKMGGSSFNEMAYRTMRSEFNVEACKGPLVSRRLPDPDTFMNDCFQYGWSLNRFYLKHPEWDVEQWSGREHARQICTHHRDEVELIINQGSNWGMMSDGSLLEQISSYKKNAGIASALDSQAELFASVRRERWQSRSVANQGPQFMLVLDEVPTTRGNHTVQQMYHLLENLLRQGRVTIVLRAAPIRPGDLDELRNQGVVIFADKKSFELYSSPDWQDLTVVDYRELLLRDEFHSVIFNQFDSDCDELGFLQKYHPEIVTGVIEPGREEKDRLKSETHSDFTITLESDFQSDLERRVFAYNDNITGYIDSLDKSQRVAKQHANYNIGTQEGLERYMSVGANKTLVVLVDEAPAQGQISNLKDLLPELPRTEVKIVYGVCTDLAQDLRADIVAQDDFYFEFEDSNDLDAWCQRILVSSEVEYLGFVASSVFA